MLHILHTWLIIGLFMLCSLFKWCSQIQHLLCSFCLNLDDFAYFMWRSWFYLLWLFGFSFITRKQSALYTSCCLLLRFLANLPFLKKIQCYRVRVLPRSLICAKLYIRLKNRVKYIFFVFFSEENHFKVFENWQIEKYDK